MVEGIPGLPANALGFTAKGKVTTDDYEWVIIPAVDALCAREGEIRFLYHLGEDFDGIEPGAAWDDAKLGLKHLRGWERMAVVTDVEWIRATIRAIGIAIPGHVRVFANADLDEAKRWISE